jgi:hypothetical protein
VVYVSGRCAIRCSNSCVDCKITTSYANLCFTLYKVIGDKYKVMGKIMNRKGYLLYIFNLQFLLRISVNVHVVSLRN